MGKMVIIDEPRNLETPFSLKVGTDDAFYQGAEDFFTGALPDAAERVDPAQRAVRHQA